MKLLKNLTMGAIVGISTAFLIFGAIPSVEIGGFQTTGIGEHAEAVPLYSGINCSGTVLADVPGFLLALGGILLGAGIAMISIGSGGAGGVALGFIARMLLKRLGAWLAAYGGVYIAFSMMIGGKCIGIRLA